MRYIDFEKQVKRLMKKSELKKAKAQSKNNRKSDSSSGEEDPEHVKREENDVKGEVKQENEDVFMGTYSGTKTVVRGFGHGNRREKQVDVPRASRSDIPRSLHSKELVRGL